MSEQRWHSNLLALASTPFLFLPLMIPQVPFSWLGIGAIPLCLHFVLWFGSSIVSHVGKLTSIAAIIVFALKGQPYGSYIGASVAGLVLFVLLHAFDGDLSTAKMFVVLFSGCAIYIGIVALTALEGGGEANLSKGQSWALFISLGCLVIDTILMAIAGSSMKEISGIW